MADLSLLSGFAKGFAETKRDAAERERRRESWEIEKMNKKLQQQSITMQQQILKMKQAREDREWALKEKVLQRFEKGEQKAKQAQPKEKESPQFGESFNGAGGVIDDLAGYNLDPLSAGMLGGEFQDIYENQMKERDYTRKRSEDLYDRRKDAQAVDRIPIQTPQGTFLQTLPKHPGLAGQGSPGGGMIQTGPPPVKIMTRTEPKTGKKYQVPVNEQTGQEQGERSYVEPLKGESAETASKIALAHQGLKHIKTLKSMFIDPKTGDVNRKLILSSNVPGGGFGEGRLAYGTFLDALDARARAATGAAMPESEIKTYTKIYWPSNLDDDATVIDKLERLDGFMNSFVKVMDPSGINRKRMDKDDKDLESILFK